MGRSEPRWAFGSKRSCSPTRGFIDLTFSDSDVENQSCHSPPGGSDPRPEVTFSSSSAQLLSEGNASVIPKKTLRSMSRRSAAGHHQKLLQQEIIAPQLPTSQSGTQVLKVFGTLDEGETDNLVNTIQTIFEGNESARHDGVVLLYAPHLVSKPGSILLPVESQDFQFECSAHKTSVPGNLRGLGLIIKDAESRLRSKRPKFQEPKILSQDDMERCFEEAIRPKSQNKTMPYFNIDLAHQSCRPNDEFELKCGMPMDKLSYGAGINTPYAYYSSGISVFGAHVEDWKFGSFNVVFAGAPKLWICVKTGRSQQLFEKKLRDLFPKAGKCAQFVRHLGLILTPQTLRTWGVEHYLVPQYPGHIVAVTGHTYHWGTNTGPNYAEAINFCLERDWQVDDEIQDCYDGCGFNFAGSVPMPKPHYEDGTLEEKIQRAKIAYQQLQDDHDAQLAALEDKKRPSSKAKNAAFKRADSQKTSRRKTSKAPQKTAAKGSEDSAYLSDKESSDGEASAAPRATARQKRAAGPTGSGLAAKQILGTDTTDIAQLFAAGLHSALQPMVEELKELNQRQERMMRTQQRHHRLLKELLKENAIRSESILSKIQQQTKGLAKASTSGTVFTAPNPEVTPPAEPELLQVYLDEENSLPSEASSLEDTQAEVDAEEQTACGATESNRVKEADNHLRHATVNERPDSIHDRLEQSSPLSSPWQSDLAENLFKEQGSAASKEHHMSSGSAEEEVAAQESPTAASMSNHDQFSLDPHTVKDILKMLGPCCKTCKLISIAGCSRGEPCSVCSSNGRTCEYGSVSLPTVPYWQRHVLDSLAAGQLPREQGRRGKGATSRQHYYQNYMRRVGRPDLVDALTWLPDDEVVESKAGAKMATGKALRKRGMDELGEGYEDEPGEGSSFEPKRLRAEK